MMSYWANIQCSVAVQFLQLLLTSCWQILNNWMKSVFLWSWSMHNTHHTLRKLFGWHNRITYCHIARAYFCCCYKQGAVNLWLLNTARSVKMLLICHSNLFVKAIPKTVVHVRFQFSVYWNESPDMPGFHLRNVVCCIMDQRAWRMCVCFRSHIGSNTALHGPESDDSAGSCCKHGIRNGWVMLVMLCRNS